MDKHKMGLWIGLLTILLLVGCGTAGYSYPTVLGMTGGVQTPSPEVVPAGQYDVAVDYTQLKSDDVKIKTWPIRLVGGASDRAELGIAYTRLSAEGGGTARITDFGGKYMIWMEPKDSYSLALGANYSKLSGELEGSQTRIYAVLGKDLTAKTGAYEEPSKTKAFGYVGLMYTRSTDGETDTATRPYVGLALSGEGGGSLVLEWKSEEFGDDVTSAALRYAFNPTLMGEVGVTNNFGGTDISESHRVFVGLNYRFGTAKGEDYGW